MSEGKILCSFCGSKQEQVDVLIEGDSAYICNNCIMKSYTVVNESKNINHKLLEISNLKS